MGGELCAAPQPRAKQAQQGGRRASTTTTVHVNTYSERRASISRERHGLGAGGSGKCGELCAAPQPQADKQYIEQGERRVSTTATPDLDLLGGFWVFWSVLLLVRGCGGGVVDTLIR